MKKAIVGLTILVVITITFGTIYVVAQQSLRLSTNQPQVQLTEDTVTKLNNGTKPWALIGDKVDMSASLAPFVIIYDKSGQVVAGSGYLDGSVPTIPIGVLKNTDKGSDNRISWEPKAGVRIASVSKSANKYYVTSGRSIREAESQVTTIGELVLFGWFLSISVVAIACLAIHFLNRTKLATPAKK